MNLTKPSISSLEPLNQTRINQRFTIRELILSSELGGSEGTGANRLLNYSQTPLKWERHGHRGGGLLSGSNESSGVQLKWRMKGRSDGRWGPAAGFLSERPLNGPVGNEPPAKDSSMNAAPERSHVTLLVTPTHHLRTGSPSSWLPPSSSPLRLSERSFTVTMATLSHNHLLP